MQQSRRSQYFAAALCAAVSIAIAPAGDADSSPPLTSGAPLDVYNNFGFPLGFDVSKMDLSADPRQDFRRYAAGKWLDKATLPGDLGNLDSIGLVKKQVERQVGTLLVDAAAASPGAKKGTPLQQVGDLYAAGMDVERLKALGATPLQPAWDRIAKIDGPKALAEELARLALLTNHPVFVDVSVMQGLMDPTKYVVAASDPDLALPAREDYLEADLTAVRTAYSKTITDSLVLAGVRLTTVERVRGQLWVIDDKRVRIRDGDA